MGKNPKARLCLIDSSASPLGTGPSGWNNISVLPETLDCQPHESKDSDRHVQEDTPTPRTVLGTAGAYEVGRSEQVTSRTRTHTRVCTLPALSSLYFIRKLAEIENIIQ